MNVAVTFDRFRLSIPNTSLTLLKPDLFKTTFTGDGIRIISRYEQNHPFYYGVTIDYAKNTTVLEYSGKVLLDDYPSLINHTNIASCIDNINKYGVCYITTQDAIDQAYVLQCDVTKDIPAYCDIPSLYRNLTIRNNKKWCLRDITSNRFTIENTVTTKRMKIRLLVYDKAEEMSRKPNEEFLSAVSNRDEQIAYFKN